MLEKTPESTEENSRTRNTAIYRRIQSGGQARRKQRSGARRSAGSGGSGPDPGASPGEGELLGARGITGLRLEAFA